MRKESFQVGDYVEVKEGGCKGWRGPIETISHLDRNYNLIAVRNEKTGRWGYFREKQLTVIKGE